MEAHSCRILLVVLTATFTIAFNFPWEAARRHVNRRWTELRRRTAGRARGPLSRLPWPQIVGAKYAVVVPLTSAPGQQPAPLPTTFYN